MAAGALQLLIRLTMLRLLLLLILTQKRLPLLLLSRRLVQQTVVELAPIVGRQADRLVPGRELLPFAFHFGLVAHVHHER